MRVLPLTFLLPLAACAVEPLPVSEAAAPVAPPPPAVAECKAEPAQTFVGRAFIPSLPEAVRIASGSSLVRTIRPGTMVTKDFRTERLNVDVDAANRVTRIYCG
jgi:hypothetical protein